MLITTEVYEEYNNNRCPMVPNARMSIRSTGTGACRPSSESPDPTPAGDRCVMRFGPQDYSYLIFEARVAGPRLLQIDPTDPYKHLEQNLEDIGTADSDLEKVLAHFRVSMKVPSRGTVVPAQEASESLWFHIEVYEFFFLPTKTKL